MYLHFVVIWGLGLASIIATVVFLGTKGTVLKGKKQIMVVGSIIFVALLSYGLYLTSQTENFFEFRYIILLTVGFTFASMFLLQKKKLLFGASILFVTLVPAIFINPVSVGLDPIFEKKLSRAVIEENEKTSELHWVIYGNHVLANFIKASGANVFNGVQYVPKLDKFKILDPFLKTKMFTIDMLIYLLQNPRQ